MQFGSGKYKTVKYKVEMFIESWMEALRVKMNDRSDNVTDKLLLSFNMR